MGLTIVFIKAMYSYGPLPPEPKFIVLIFVWILILSGIVKPSFRHAPWTNESPITKIFDFFVTLFHFFSEFLRPNLSVLYLTNPKPSSQ